MGQIEDLRLFAMVVDSQSISKAADKLNIAKSAVSRRLNLLENRFATTLINRSPGRWDVTETGRELYQRAVRVVGDVDEIEADFAHQRQSVSGPLSVSIPREFGLDYLRPALLRFVSDHPEIQLTVDFDDRRVDLDRENYDLVIRITETVDPNLTSVPLGQSTFRLYASPGYAQSRSLPATPKGLVDHPLLHYGPGRRASWVFDAHKKPQTIEFQPALNSNSGQFLLQAVRSGAGIARLPDFIAAKARAAGDLVVVLPHTRMSHAKIVCAYSNQRLVNRRMARFIKDISSACLSL